MIRPALVAVALLALLVPSAAGHGGGGKGYTSAVTSVSPATPGLQLQVVSGDDQLQLVNRTPHTVIVLGYQQEPYLRFDGSHGVDVNMRSPAFTLNLTRYGNVTLPPNADPKAAPVWHRIEPGPSYTWHDHRIHWMSTIDPPAVRGSRGEAHHIFDWTVPLRVDGRTALVHGTLDYAPSGGGHRTLWMLLAGGALLAVTLAGMGTLIFRRARA